MIVSFASKALKKLFEEESFGNLNCSKEIERATLKKLFILDAAPNLNDLACIPGNRLEKLHGDLKDHYSIRVNKQWRIIFKWDDNDAYDVKLVDYH